MNETITSFLQQQTCATICLLDSNGNPYCFSCFYAFNNEKGLLYFKSSADAYHSELIKINPLIAGTILPDKLNPLLVKGIQLAGLALNEQDPLTEKASLLYHKRHPLALNTKGDIRTIRINTIKMTDGTKGFGKKINWSRSE
jgi:uncharacterized protein YhbP (UPF0306 family)